MICSAPGIGFLNFCAGCEVVYSTTRERVHSYVLIELLQGAVFEDVWIGEEVHEPATPYSGTGRHPWVAAVAVFFHHIWLSMLPASSEKSWPLHIRYLWEAASYGRYGVDLFFVLSGFLITCILIEEKDSPRYYQDFYWKRALRVLPLYLCCVVMSMLLASSVGYLVLSSLFLANFAYLFHLTGARPFWTLSIEEQFYLLWPTVVRRMRPSTLIFWSAVLGMSAVLLRFLFAIDGHYNYYISFLRCDGLAFGAALACFYRQSGRAPKKQRATTVLTGLMALGVGLFFISNALEAKSFAASSQRLYAFSVAMTQTGVVLLSGAFIGLVVLYSGSPVLRIFRSKLLVFFGLISYAFYMLHLYVIDRFDRYVGIPATGDERACWIRFAACLAITIALSVASRYIVELPAMRLRKRVLSHPKPETPAEQWPPLPLARMD